MATRRAAACCFVSIGNCFFVLSPVGAGQCFKDVHPFFGFGCCMLDVTGEGEHAVEVDSEDLRVFFQLDKIVFY